MPGFDRHLLSPRFSHVYVEEAAAEHPRARRILARFPKAVRVSIRHYKDVFCRKHQNFPLQKRASKLILALHRPPHVYAGSPACEDFGHRHFYYCSSVMNCLYDCEYCYLQGMYPSAHLVVFVDSETLFSEVDGLLGRHPVYLCPSYDTDLLALERLTGFADEWLDFAAGRPDLLLELRTKSPAIAPFLHRKPVSNVIVAWTLSPESVIQAYERGTPTLAVRLRSAGAVARRGWRVRLCWDPILAVEKAEATYAECLRKAFEIIPADLVQDVSLGPFRMGRDLLKRARRRRPDARLLAYPYALSSGTYTLPDPERSRLLEAVAREAAVFMPEERIYVDRSAA